MQSEGGDDDPELGAFELQMRKGEYLRRLRDLEEQDEAERGTAVEEESNNVVTVTTSSGHEIVQYEKFLENQRFYDDLKHINYKFIDYGTLGSTVPLVLEQDHKLGKGGLAWDAAFILGEFLVDLFQSTLSFDSKSFIELGAGTGLAGLIVAKLLPVHVHLTDLPELLPLMKRNASRNLSVGADLSVSDDLTNDEVFQEYIMPRIGKECHAKGRATVSELCWGNHEQEYRHGTFDVVMGADVVASLYDPYALADTIANLSLPCTKIYISFKERQSDYHEQFEAAMRQRFTKFETIGHSSRNRNPGVSIIVAEGKSM